MRSATNKGGAFMNFWWASQGRNHSIVIDHGTLWTCKQGNGVVPEARRLLWDMKPGDIVFHYGQQYLRAVSTVTHDCVPFERPPGYTKMPDETDQGWLITVDPIMKNLNLPWQRVAELIRWGSPGPLRRDGVPALKYMSRLAEEDGLALVTELGISPPVSDEGTFLGLPEDTWGLGETDAVALAAVRQEQAALRRHLLGGRPSAPCAVCGEILPAKLLIAGHIKPRSESTEEERKDFKSAAMLVCALGCDALFEWGYISVDDSGIVRRGRTAETEGVRDAVDLLIGKKCTAHNELTAPQFAARSHLAQSK
ncbi:hypothetical protein ACHMXB_01075 [Arthrobacter sp. UC242_113]|uniref:HNH endonuclease signature motif containing protein n=1 Tax=Arthrobacter sp. UC242_113 TaxID=3374550 RepID=UPI0037562E49